MESYQEENSSLVSKLSEKISRLLEEPSVLHLRRGDYQSDTEITSFIIPDGVTCIPRFSFQDCKNLETIIIPDTVTSIEAYSFRGCSSLKTIQLPQSVVRIGSSAFEGCNSLQEIAIPEGVSVIESSSFENCSALKKVALPSTLKKIEWRSFFNCESLEEVSFPEGLVEIGSAAFFNCCLLRCKSFPSRLEIIGGSAFEGCKKLECVIAPDTIRLIGGAAFRGCESLCRVSLSPGIKAVGAFTFEGCINLEEVFIPEGVGQILKNAFKGCPKLKIVQLPTTIKRIGESAFEDCESLVSIVVPDGLTKIGKKAFQNCSRLREISIPPQVLCIHERTFSGCSSLTHVFLHNDIIYLRSRAFAGCIKVSFSCLPSHLKELSLDTVDDLHQLADGNGWIATEKRVFKYCGDETAVIIPNSINRIEDYAFDNTPILTRITLSSNIEHIGIFNGSWERMADDKGFVASGHKLYKYCGLDADINVPESIEVIETDAFSNLLPYQHVKLPNNVRQFCCKGNERAFADPNGFIASKTILFGYCGERGLIEIPEGIEYIRRNAEESFLSIRNGDLMIQTSVKLPSSFKGKWSNDWSIYADAEGFVIAGKRLLKYIGKKTEIQIPDSVEEIDEWAFTNATHLTRVIVPAHIKSFLVHIAPKVFVWENS